MISQIMQIPYLPGGRDWAGADCWGIVLICLKELMAVDAQAHSGLFFEPGTDPQAASEQIHGLVTIDSEFAPVSLPRFGDFALLSLLGHPVHIGFMISRHQMLHSQSGRGVTIADLTSPQWSKRVTGYYRHKDLLNVR